MSKGEVIMKITSFNPLIATAHSDSIIKLFEELGFERRHTKEGIEIEDKDNAVFRMKDANGFYLDVTQEASIQRDITGIRINVDDFDEAYNLFISHGFEKYVEEGVIDTPSSKFVLLKSPSGFVINLVQHITK
jgi:hypothetical protein